MKKNDVTVTDIISAINFEHQLSPTGYQNSGPKETYVRVHSEFKNAEECENLVIPSRAGLPLFKQIHIGEIAN